MDVYHLYGLCIHSEIPLPVPQFSREEGVGCPDLVVRERSVGLYPTKLVDLGSFQYATDGTDIVARVASLAWFRISGMKILVEYDVPPRPRAVGIVLASWIINLFLMRRGYLLFHGSSVECNGHAVAIIGNCGAGKSTTAAALSARGHAVLCDDMVLVSGESGHGITLGRQIGKWAKLPLVHPGIPWLKLLPDAFSTFAGDPTHYPQLFDGLDKFRMQPKNVAKDPVPLALVCVLSASGVPQPLVQEVAGKDKLRMLMPHMSILNDIEGFGSVFIRLASMLDTIPVLEITRPLKMDTTEWMVATIEQALGGSNCNK